MSDKASQPTGDNQQVDSAALRSLQQEIKYHERRDASRSVLNRAAGAVWDCFQSEDHSLGALKALYEDAQKKIKTGDAKTIAQVEKDIAEAIQADRKALATRETVSHYAAGFAKTATLFMRGPIGVAGTIGVYGLDQWNPSESLQNQIADASMGMARGGGMKLIFHVIGDKPQLAMTKGVFLGIGNTSLDMLLSRQTYKDGVRAGLGKTAGSVLDVKARAFDGAVFALSEGTFRGLNQLTGGRIADSPVLSTMLTGTAFGMSSGGVGEYMRQKNAGEKFDFGKIVEHAAIQGGLDTVAASFGGVQALKMQNRLSAGANEFAVLSGWEQLSRMRSGDPAATALLQVKQVLGKRWTGDTKLGPEQTLLLAHDGGAIRPELANSADRLAVCNPANLPESQRAKHILPDAKGDVRVEPNADASRIKIVPDDPSTRPENSIVLSGGHGHGHGHGDGPSFSGTSVDKLLPGGEGDYAQPRPAGPQKVILRVHDDSLVPSGRELLRLSLKLCAEGASAGDHEAVVSYLRSNPDLASFARAVARQIGNAKLDQAVQEGIARPDGLEHKIYDTPLGLRSTHQILEELKSNYLPDLRDASVAPQYQEAIRDHLVLYPELRPAVEHIARTSRDLKIVQGLDQVLGTNHAEALKGRLEQERLAAGTPAAEPPAKEAITPPAVEPKAIVDPLLEPARDARDAAGKPAAPALTPEAAMAEQVKAVSSTDAAIQAKAIEDLAEKVNDLSAREVVRWAKAAKARGATEPQFLELLAKALEHADLPRQGIIVGELSDQLINLSDRSFLRWRQAAENTLPDRMLLIEYKSEIDALPVEIQKQFLSRVTIEAPKWAKDYMEFSKIQAEQRGQKPPWPIRYNDYLENRLALLCRVFKAGAESRASGQTWFTPELQSRLIKLGASDKEGLIRVLDSVGYREVFDSNKKPTGVYKWNEGDARIEAARNVLAGLLPGAQSMEPVKYTFQFIREQYSLGAIEAARRLKPASMSADEQTKWNELEDTVSKLANGKIRGQAGDRNGGRTQGGDAGARQDLTADKDLDAARLLGKQAAPEVDVLAELGKVATRKPVVDQFRPSSRFDDEVLAFANSIPLKDGSAMYLPAFSKAAAADYCAQFCANYFNAKVFPDGRTVRIEVEVRCGQYVPVIQIPVEGGKRMDGLLVIENGRAVGVAFEQNGKTILWRPSAPKDQITSWEIKAPEATPPAPPEPAPPEPAPPEPAPPEPAPPQLIIPTEEAERLKFVKDRWRHRMPCNAIKVETLADGTTVTTNENPDQDGSFLRMAQKSNEWARAEFKDGLVITKFADGSFEVIPPGGVAFKIDAPAQPQPQQPPPPEQQPAATPPDDPVARKAYLLARVSDAKVTPSERSRLESWFTGIRKSLNESKLRKMWREDQPITSLGLKKGQVSFRQVCKMFDWVPDGASD